MATARLDTCGSPRWPVIDGQVVNVRGPDALVATLTARCRDGRGFCVFTLNLDHLVKRRANRSFREAYARATFVTADGRPIVAEARRQGLPIDLATGADLIDPLCAAMASADIPVFLFGSAPDALGLAAARLRRAHPSLSVAGSEAPPLGFDPLSVAAEAAMDRIAASGAGLCFVALGAPKQELFADRALRRHPGIGFVCIGAGLDFLAGHQRRAPAFVRRTGLEWIWRMAVDPRRLGIRYARCAALLIRLRFAPARRSV